MRSSGKRFGIMGENKFYEIKGEKKRYKSMGEKKLFCLSERIKFTFKNKCADPLRVIGT